MQSWIGTLNVVNMSILHKLIYKLHAVTIKIPAKVSINIDKIIFKWVWENNGARIAKIILKGRIE